MIPGGEAFILTKLIEALTVKGPSKYLLRIMQIRFLRNSREETRFSVQLQAAGWLLDLDSADYFLEHLFF